MNNDIAKELMVRKIIRSELTHGHVHYICPCGMLLGKISGGISTLNENSSYYGLEHIFKCAEINDKKLSEEIRIRIEIARNI